MVFKKKINSEIEFYNLYFKQNPPPPPYFYIYDIKFKVDCFDFDYDKGISIKIKCQDIPNDFEDISNYIKIEQQFDLKEFLGYEFVWKFKNYDYVYNYLEFDDYFFFVNLDKLFDYRLLTLKDWKIIIDTTEGEFSVKLMNNITTSGFRSIISTTDEVLDFGIKAIKKHLKNHNNILTF
jgi:hypothetical protein